MHRNNFTYLFTDIYIPLLSLNKVSGIILHCVKKIYVIYFSFQKFIPIIVCPKQHIWTVFKKYTHTCERNCDCDFCAIEIDEDSIIDTYYFSLGKNLRNKNRLLTGISNGEY